jgi:hypothetical protein
VATATLVSPRTWTETLTWVLVEAVQLEVFPVAGNRASDLAWEGVSTKEVTRGGAFMELRLNGWRHGPSGVQAPRP